AVIRLRLRFDAVIQDELVLDDDVGARRADAEGRALLLAVAAEELGLDRHGELLVFAHRLRRLAVEHESAVAPGPARAALALFAEEAVLHPRDVVRELVLEEEVAELLVERLVLVVGDGQDALLDAEGVEVVDAGVEAGDLRRPAVEVLAVEELHPL